MSVRFAWPSVLLLGLTCSVPAQAVTKKECVAAHVDAQRLRKEAKLSAAREKLLVCANDACMKAVRKDCLTWLDEVGSSMPTVVVVAKDASGAETFEVNVYVDDELVAEGLDGKAIEIDPGTHTIRYEIEGSDPIEEEVLIREGERNKTLEVSFASEEEPPPAAEPEPSSSMSMSTDDVTKDQASGPPIVAYALGGLGVVALGGAGFFWLSSQSDTSELDDSGCEPRCKQSDVDSIKQKRLIGDVLLGVGVVSIGVAGYLYVSHESSKKKTAARAPHFDVAPLPGGGYATVRGRF